MSRMKDLFQRSVAAAAMALRMPKAAPQKAFRVTHTAGRWGTNYRRIIEHITRGPLFRQVGIRWVHGEAQPIMQQYREHRFLHATKGWRTYTRGLPGMNPMRRPV